MKTNKSADLKARQQQRRQELLDAAIEYIFEHGFSSLSIRPLSEALGISHRTLLYHFGSKEQLVTEVICEIGIRERAFFTAFLSEQEQLSAATLGWAFWKHFTAPRYERFFRLFFEIYGLALQEPARYAKFLRGVITPWLPFFEQLLTREGYSSEEATTIATFLFATARGLQFDLLVTQDQKRIQAAAELLGQLLERRFWPAPAASGEEPEHQH